MWMWVWMWMECECESECECNSSVGIAKQMGASHMWIVTCVGVGVCM